MWVVCDNLSINQGSSHSILISHLSYLPFTYPTSTRKTRLVRCCICQYCSGQVRSVRFGWSHYHPNYFGGFNQALSHSSQFNWQFLLAVWTFFQGWLFSLRFTRISQTHKWKLVSQVTILLHCILIDIMSSSILHVKKI